MRHVSPLRYPGGKAVLLPFFKGLIERGGYSSYAEPYCGGAAVALGLLLSESVNTIHINDASRTIWAFWDCVVHRSSRLVQRVRSCSVTMDEWHRQKAVLASEDVDPDDLGFAAFFVNRTSRSGIIGTGGVIGGLKQTGKYKIDARFNKENLISRIELIASYRRRIYLSNLDAVQWIGNLPPTSFVYFDPPYYNKAEALYPRWYETGDHAAVAAAILGCSNPWVVSYDDCPEIRSLYESVQGASYSLRYTANHARRGGREVIYARPDLAIDWSGLPGGQGGGVRLLQAHRGLSSGQRVHA